MPCFHVVFKDRTEPGPHSLSFVAADAGQALAIAQRQSGEAEIWREDEFLCSVEQSSVEQGFWMISSDRKYPDCAIRIEPGNVTDRHRDRRRQTA